LKYKVLVDGSAVWVKFGNFDGRPEFGDSGDEVVTGIVANSSGEIYVVGTDDGNGALGANGDVIGTTGRGPDAAKR
jgi:hypothetical protein